MAEYPETIEKARSCGAPGEDAARLAGEIAQKLGLAPARVQAAIGLIDEGNTIPFIARYRKEATGSMDDQKLRELADELAYLRKLSAQKEAVRTAIEEQGKWSAELAEKLAAARTLAEVEDIYRPYRPKRKTRASTAKARGLEPLAQRLLQQAPAASVVLPPTQFVASLRWQARATSLQRQSVTMQTRAPRCAGCIWPGACWFQKRPKTALKAYMTNTTISKSL